MTPGVALDHDVLEREVPELRQSVCLAIKEGNAGASAGVKRRTGPRLFTCEIDGTVEALIPSCHRSRTEASECRSGVVRLSGRTHQGVLVPYRVESPLSRDRVAVLIQDPMRHERPAVLGPAHERFGDNAAVELMVHVKRNGVVAPLVFERVHILVREGSKPIGDADHLVAA